MAELVFEQALWHRPDRQPPQLLGRSPGFPDIWLGEAEQMIRDFGERPPGMACPLAVFARPLGRGQVAVVRVADVPERGDVLAFHFLVVERAAYERFVGDPFELAELLPPSWEAGPLPVRTLSAGAVPVRTVEQVRTVLKRVKLAALREDEDPEAPDFRRTVVNSESPALLGGTQVLMDGGRLVFERPAGDLALVAGLWTLLPDGVRGRLWPASFAFSNELDFDVLAVPRLDPEEYEGYTTEEQAADYPQGSYELAVQMAAESGDQAELERVLARRGSGEVLRRTALLLAAFLLIVLGGRLFSPPEGIAPAHDERREQAALAAGIAAAADPWTALGLYYYGKVRWGGRE